MFRYKFTIFRDIYIYMFVCVCFCVFVCVCVINIVHLVGGIKLSKTLRCISPVVFTYAKERRILVSQNTTVLYVVTLLLG